jgi:hypothetical protein
MEQIEPIFHTPCFQTQGLTAQVYFDCFDARFLSLDASPTPLYAFSRTIKVFFKLLSWLIPIFQLKTSKEDGGKSQFF